MLVMYRPHRQTTVGSPAHTVALDSSLPPSHSHHTNASFYPASDEPELQSGATNETDIRRKEKIEVHTTITILLN